MGYEVKSTVKLEKVYSYEGKDYHVKAEGVATGTYYPATYWDPDDLSVEGVEITSLECEEGDFPEVIGGMVRDDLADIANESSMDSWDSEDYDDGYPEEDEEEMDIF